MRTLGKDFLDKLSAVWEELDVMQLPEGGDLLTNTFVFKRVRDFQFMICPPNVGHHELCSTLSFL